MVFSFPSTPQQSLFQSPFQQSSSPLFQQQFQQQQQQQQQFQQQQSFLLTNEKSPASYGTKWADLHPETQKILLQIDEQVLGYKDESQRLDQCTRLYESFLSNDGFELDTSHVVQELGAVGTAMGQQKAVILGLMAVVKDALRNAELGIRSYMIVRPRFVHKKVGANSSASASAQALGATVAPGQSNQTGTTDIMPVYDFYSGLPRKPSPFSQQTVARFEKKLSELRQWIEELEQLLISDSQRNSSGSNSSLLQSLPKVLSNVHEFFVHVAAKVEIIHQYIESMKTAYLADQRRRGEGNDPFLEADHRATAKQEAAAKRVHPTLHLPATAPQSTQPAGLFASSATPVTSAAPQTSTAFSSSSLFSSLSTPATTPSLFSTPATSAPAPSPFGAPTTSSQTPLFGTSSGSSLFPSTSTPSLFATPAPTTAATGSALFSTPFASAGTVAGSGSSFGNKQSRPRARTSRR